jgi:hypothetical protein
MNLLVCYSQRAIPDGLFDEYESVIELYIRRENPEKFGAAFRVSREIFEARTSTVAFHQRWKIKKLLSKCDRTRQIGNSNYSIVCMHPTILQGIVSLDPMIRKQAYCDVLFLNLNKPFDFLVP